MSDETYDEKMADESVDCVREKAEARVEELEEEVANLRARVGELEHQLESELGLTAGDPPECDGCEARVAELEEEASNLSDLASGLHRTANVAEERARKAEARVAELTPPEGYVDVRLPREDVEWYASRASADCSYRTRRVRNACRKALGGDS
jgi:chromosome segregation ATPase